MKEIIAQVTTKMIVAAMAAIITPLLLIFKKKIGNVLQSKYNAFVIKPAAQKERSGSVFFVFVALCIVLVYIMHSFKEYKDGVAKLENEISQYERVIDSLNYRSIHEKFKTKNYTDEVKDIKEKIAASVKSDSNLLIREKLDIEKNELRKINISMTALTVVNWATESLLTTLAGIFILMYGISQLKNKFITDFDWKMNKIRKWMTQEEMNDLEYRWASMQTQDHHRELINTLNTIIKEHELTKAI